MKGSHSLDVPAHVELAFEDGTPIAVNGIAMSPQELSESLTTIAGDHGFDVGFGVLASARAVSGALADSVVSAARDALACADSAATGVVRVVLHHGERTIVSVSPAVPVQPA